MASRRTRSGTAFGFAGEDYNSKKLNSSKKQNKKDMNDVEDEILSPAKNVEKSKDASLSVTPTQSQLKAFLECDDAKENIPFVKKIDLTPVKPKIIDNVNFHGITEKNELLVSLLGRKQDSAVWPKFGISNDISLKKSSECDMATFEDNRNNPQRNADDDHSIFRKRSSSTSLECPQVSHSGICIFSNSNPQVQASSDDDGLKMPEISGETFLVSLSNDESKELNMVKKTLSTMHVNSGLHQYLPPNYNYQEVPSKHVLGKIKPPSEIVDKKTKKDLCKDPHEISQEFESETEEEDTLWTNNSTAHDLDDDMNIKSKGELKFHNMDSSPLQFESYSNDFESEDMFDLKENSKIGSQFPLMEEILTEHEFTSQSVKDGNDITNAPDLKDNYSHTHSIMNNPIAIQSMSSSPLDENELNSDSQSFIKRSERLRCRTETKVSGTSPSLGPQTVISTMKPVPYECKKKVVTSSNAKKSKKVNLSKSNKSKKLSKIKGDKKSKNSSKLGDVTKSSKPVMSQAVMEGIVKSIEETVSRGTKEPSIFLTKPRVETQSLKLKLCKTSNKTSVKNPDIASYLLSDKSMDISSHPFSMALMGETPSTSTHKISFEIIKKNESLKKCKLKLKASAVSKKSKSVNSSKTSESTKHLKLKKSKEVKPEATPTKTIHSSDANTSNGSISSQESTPTNSKRFRKKTRKAEEALSDNDVFCEDDLPSKRSKSKKRCSGAPSAPGSSTSRKSRRSSQLGGLMADPKLGDNAFVLWASEHRREVEQQHPDSNTVELDSILASRWSLVPDNAKIRFYLRAKDAICDESRTITSSAKCNESETPASISDSLSQDFPIYNDFVSLSEDNQRELLRKWLKIFQKILPKTEYKEFISGFKKSCGSEGRIRKTRVKRPDSIDSIHFKTLFDMIRISKPSVIDIYRENLPNEVRDTYSLMVRHLVNKDPWHRMQVGCKSTLLTDLLDDLQLVETKPILEPGQGGDICTLDVKKLTASQEKDSSNDGAKVKIEQDGIFVPLEDWECILTSDLAIGLLEELHHQGPDLPIIDQVTLDEMFLAPPSGLQPGTLTQQRCSNTGSAQVWRSDATPTSIATPTSMGFTRYIMGGDSHFANGTSGPVRPGCYMKTEGQYQKMSLHHPPGSNMSASGVMSASGILSASSVLAHHHPSSSLAPYAIRHGGQPGTQGGSSTLCTKRKESPMDMHSYSISVDNMFHCSSHPQTSVSRCLNMQMHKSVALPSPHHAPSTPGPMMPCQTQVRFQPHQLPEPPCPSHQQHLGTPSHFPAGSGHLDTPLAQGNKQGSHVYPIRSFSNSTSPRLYQSSMNSGPLITSLSPLRPTVKAGGPIKNYSPRCQMVPYRQHLHMSATSGHTLRKSTPTQPITSWKPSGLRGQGNLHQIKVCLPTQALKIPIAKLRGGRKSASSFTASSSSSTHIKGKRHNYPLEALPQRSSSSSICSLPYNRSSSHSVLHRVLELQGKGDAEQAIKSSGSQSFSHLPVNRSRAVQIPTSFINSQKQGEGAHHIGLYTPRSAAVVRPGGTHIQGDRSTVGSSSTSQTAVVISPLEVHRRSWAGNSLSKSTPTSLVIPTQSNPCAYIKSISSKTRGINSTKITSFTSEEFSKPGSNASTPNNSTVFISKQISDSTPSLLCNFGSRSFSDGAPLKVISRPEKGNQENQISDTMHLNEIKTTVRQTNGSDFINWDTISEPVPIDSEFCDSLVNLNPPLQSADQTETKTKPKDDKSMELKSVVSTMNSSNIEQLFDQKAHDSLANSFENANSCSQQTVTSFGSLGNQITLKSSQNEMKRNDNTVKSAKDNKQDVSSTINILNNILSSYRKSAVDKNKNKKSDPINNSSIFLETTQKKIQSNDGSDSLQIVSQQQKRTLQGSGSDTSCMSDIGLLFSASGREYADNINTQKIQNQKPITQKDEERIGEKHDLLITFKSVNQGDRGGIQKSMANDVSIRSLLLSNYDSFPNNGGSIEVMPNLDASTVSQKGESILKPKLSQNITQKVSVTKKKDKEESNAIPGGTTNTGGQVAPRKRAHYIHEYLPT